MIIAPGDGAGTIVYPVCRTKLGFDSTNVETEDTMNRGQVQGSWNQVKGKATQMWGDLTDNELDTTAGKRDDWSGGCIKYGISKVKAQEQAHI